MRARHLRRVIPLSVCGGVVSTIVAQATFPADQPLVLRGRVEERATGSSDRRLVVFTTQEGRVFSFRSDSATALLREERVRQRELQILAVVHPGGELELVRVRLLHEGQWFDLFYACETCSITSPVPGRCPCCEAPLQLREVAVPDQETDSRSVTPEKGGDDA